MIKYAFVISLTLCLLLGRLMATGFIQNKGQWSENVLYRIDIPNGALFLEKDRLTYHFYDFSELIKHHGKATSVLPHDIPLKYHAYQVVFNGSADWSEVIVQKPKKNTYNYFVGSDSTRWATQVPCFEKVIYQNIYPKIDFLMYQHQGSLKYDFVIHPGGKLSDIQLLYQGIQNLSIKNEEVIVETSIGKILEEKPFIFQEIQGEKQVVSGKYFLKKNILSFDVSAYDLNKTLCIDPALIFASYSGSTADNFGMTATYDQAGNLYSGGTAFNIGYPTTLGAFQTTFASVPGGGITDVVVSKYSPDGTSLVYSTYLGGSGTELVNSMVANDQNELYVYGPTSSANFPILGSAYDNTFNGGSSVYFVSNGANFTSGTDIYVTKFNTNASALLGSTYIGGAANDGLNSNTSPTLYDSLMFNYGDQSRGEIIIDNLDNAYITSSTRSSDFPVPNGFDPSFNGKQDAVVFKLNNNLSQLIWSSFLGGNDKDAGYSIKVDDNYQAYVCGGTSSSNFPVTAGTLQTTYQGGKSDGYVVKISASGGAILSGTYVGTNLYDQVFFVEIDPFNEVYVLGQSLGSMPVLNVGYSNANSKQFIQKLNNSLSSLTYATVFGNGSGNINLSPSAFLVDQCQNVYISGWGGNILTAIPMNGMPTTSGALYPNSPNGFDFYFAVFERDITSLLYASYFGGGQSEEHVDGGTSRFDKKGIIYQSVCAGCGANSDFPTTPGVVSNTNNSFNCNNGVFKFDFETVVQALFQSSDTQSCTDVTVHITNQSVGANAYDWNFGNGTSSTTGNDTDIVYTIPGNYVITLIATDTICQISDTVIKNIQIFPNVNMQPLPDTMLCAGDSVQYIIHSQGTATTFIWSTSPQWTDTLNLNISDSSFTWLVNASDTLYVQVGNGNCYQVDTIILEAAVISANIQASLTNCGQCNGTAFLNFAAMCSGCAYLWNDPASQTNDTAVGLCVGTYQVTVTNAIGCEKEYTIAVSDTSNLNVASQNNSPISCFGECTAEVLLNTLGGTPPFTYQWNDPLAQTGALAVNLCAGNYLVTVTDSLGCQKVASVNVNQPAILQIQSADIQSLTCFDSCNASIDLVVQGGTPLYTYQWNDPLAQTTPTLVNVCHGSYEVEITDANGCLMDSLFVISQPPLLQTQVIASKPLCFNICNGTILIEAQGGAPAYEYQFSSTGPFIEDSMAFNLCSGVYIVSVRDSLGCVVRDTVNIEQNNFTAFPVFLSADKDTIVQYETTVLHANPSETEVFLWSPSQTLSSATSLNPVASPLQTTTYTFTVIDDQNPACRFDSTITIYVLDYICADPSIFVPNAFTPNTDGSNDVLFLRGNMLKDIYFTIYNRWGEKVFETFDVNKGWDGQYKGRPCDPGVFDYYLKATCPNQEKIFTKGNITLIR